MNTMLKTQHNLETKLYKINLPKLLFKNQAREHSNDSPGFPINIWGKSVQGVISYDRLFEQTDKTA